MSFVQSTLELALYTWASTVSARTTIWYYPNAPRPALPYLSLCITDIKAIGWDYELPPDDLGNSALLGNREFTLEINYYGDDALDKIEKLYTSLRSQSVKQTLAASGVFFVDRIMQSNITELIDSRFEQRYVLELQFRCSNQGITAPDTFDVGVIATVEIDGTIDGGNVDHDLHMEIGDPYVPPDEEP